VPNNATLIVVGDIEHDEVQELAQKYFGWMPRFPEPPAPTVERAREPEGPRSIRLKERKAPVPVAGIGWRTPPAGHDDQLALSMATSILGMGESSRLYRRLVIEEDLATAAFAGVYALADDGIAGVAASLKPMGSDIPRTMESLRAEVARFLEEGPTEEEMIKARNAELRDLVTSRRTTMGQAQALGTAIATWGDISRINSLEAEVRAMTAEDVRAAAEKWLAPEREMEVVVEQNLLGSIFGGGAKDENDSEAAEVAPAAVVDEATIGEGKPGLVRPETIPAAPPEAGKLTADLTIDAPTRTLDNGLEVVVITDHELPMVSYLLGVEVGAVHDPADAPGTAAVAADMLTRGTEGRDYATLASILDRNAIELTANADREETTISASALVDHADLTLELLADVLLHPTFPADEFAMLKGQLAAQLAVEETDPSFVANRVTRRAVWGQHPYSRSARPELADLPAITVEGMSDWWSTHLQPSRATLFIVGALEADEAFALAEKHLGNWNSDIAIAEPEWIDPPVIEGRRIILVDSPGDQAQLRVGHHGFTRHEAPYIPGRVLSQVLGGGFNSRLTDRVRGELGLTYGIGGGFSSDIHGGSFRVSTFTKNESVGQALEAIFDVLEGMKTEAPGAEEITIARNTIVGQFVRGRETPMSKAFSLWQLRAEKLPADFPTRVLEGVQATTPDDVISIARDQIHPDDSIVVVVGPAAQLREQLAAFGEVEVVSPTGEPIADAALETAAAAGPAQ
jgi:zinc protease